MKYSHILSIFLSAGIVNLGAQKMYDLPTYSEAVDRAVAAENLKKVASNTNDPEILLGLAFLAKVGDPARLEIARLAVTTKPEYAPIVAVLAVTMDGIENNTVSELIKSDPQNALGYYLQGKLLYDSGSEKEALESFRKAASCPELRLYDAITGEALFKALDALNLKGRDRLCAASWMATRSSSFSALGLQFVPQGLMELARTADLATRKEISELLLVVAGHFFASNFNNRGFAQRAAESAFRLKAEIAATEQSPKMDGYAAAVQALVSVSWPGIKETYPHEDPLRLAQFVPSRIHRAFALFNEKEPDLYELKANLPESDKAAFENARQQAMTAANELIQTALPDGDSIIGAYLKGRPVRKYSDGPWVSYWSPVEKLMSKKPEVFRAAIANEQAMHALANAGQSDPQRRNIRRMMDVGRALWSYASEHKRTFPENIQVLFEQKHLKDSDAAKSVLTGKPYIYIGSGKKVPEKSNDLGELMLLYDDTASNGNYQCVMADGSGQEMTPQRFKEQLKRQGAADPQLR
jgi:hypothetical protein